MVEPEYLRWARENMPEEMFQEMERSNKWAAEWRDKRIAELEDWQKREVEMLEGQCEICSNNHLVDADCNKCQTRKLLKEAEGRG